MSKHDLRSLFNKFSNISGGNLHYFVRAFVNILFFTSSEMRVKFLSDVPKQQKIHLVTVLAAIPGKKIGIRTLEKISEDKNLLGHIIYLGCLIDNKEYKPDSEYDHSSVSVIASNFYAKKKIAYARQILIRLYEIGVCQPIYALQRDYSRLYGIEADIKAAMVTAYLRSAEKLGQKHKAEIFQAFQNNCYGNGKIDLEEKELQKFNDVITPTLLPISIRLFMYACFTNNSGCLNYVLREYKKLAEVDQLSFKTQVQNQLQNLNSKGCTFSEKIQEILKGFDFSQETELQVKQALQTGSISEMRIG